MGKAQSGKISISGQTIDSVKNEPLPFVQLAIYELDSESPVTGTTSDIDGNFSLNINKGTYRIELSSVGYKKVKIIEKFISSVSMGTVGLSEDVKVMDEVVVEANEVKRPVVSTIEGLEIRPDQTLSNTGGTLLDILRNTPSVRVSDDGSVSLRGSGSTNILINGRNSSLTSDLEQIPASAIKNIQIINNPNARYDAQAAGGVINIKLKQGGDNGSSLNTEVTGGTRRRHATTIRGTHANDKFKVYGGYTYRNFPSIGNNWTERLTYDDNLKLLQFGERERQDVEHTFNAGADFFFGQNKITYEGVLNTETESSLEDNRARVTNIETDALRTQYIRSNTEDEDNLTYDNALIYERLFKDSREFKFLVSVSNRDELETQNIDVYQNIFERDELADATPNGRERSFNDQIRNTTIIQSDYIQEFDFAKLEVGYKSTFRKFDTDYTYEIFNNATNNWVNQVNISNHFIYSDQVHAGYFLLNKKLANFNITAGARVEGTIVNTELLETNETNRQAYIDLFPSLQMSYNTSDINSFKMTYSRRIDRPSGWRLNPFPDVSDSLNVRIGNANLQPEYVNSFEVGHMYNPGKVSLTTNLFYRRVDNQVDWIVEVIDGISYRGPQNLLSSDNYGLEMIGSWDIAKWWQINGSFSFFGVQVDGTNLDNSFTNQGQSWYVKFNSDFHLPWDIDLQITGNYEAPEIEAQGSDREIYYLDASLQRDFFEEKLGLNLSYRDLFNTRVFRGENFGSSFEQRFLYNRETRILLVTLSYNII